MQGNMIAKVVDNVDPEGRYRVRVSFPWLADQYSKETTSDGGDSKVQSFWARITTGLASSDFGGFFLPEIDDEVMVAFEDGDFSRPIVIGGLWNGEKTAPAKLTYSPDQVEVDVPNSEQGGKNDYRFIRSRMGHTLAFIDAEGKGGVSLRSNKSAELYIDDEDGKERIRLYDKDQQQWLEIDTANKKITLETDTGDILIKAKEKITIDCKDLEVKAGKTIKIDAGESITQNCKSYSSSSSQNTELSAGPKMKFSASRIDLNP
jgi:uncharacterized protein involved in type VI secretion and phage assembly